MDKLKEHINILFSVFGKGGDIEGKSSYFFLLRDEKEFEICKNILNICKTSKDKFKVPLPAEIIDYEETTSSTELEEAFKEFRSYIHQNNFQSTPEWIKKIGRYIGIDYLDNVSVDDFRTKVKKQFNLLYKESKKRKEVVFKDNKFLDKGEYSLCIRD